MPTDNIKFVDPETLKEVDFDSLEETPYKERCEGILLKLGKKNEKVAVIPKEKVVRNTTEEGFKLDKTERTKEGGALGKLERLPTFDPKKPWLHQYGRQLCRYVKPNSHKYGKERWVSFYTESFHKVHATKKFENVRDIIASLAPVREQYIKDMNPKMAKKDYQTFLIATMIAMTDESAFRMGRKEDCIRKKNPIYGITTLLAKHFKKCVDENGNTYYKIAFKGKDSVLNHKVIKNPDTVRNLKYILKDKDDNDFVFSIGKHTISGTEVNDYLHEISHNPNFNFHKFRHKKATETFLAEIEKMKEKGEIPDMPTVKEVKAAVDAAITKASEILCNTLGACRKSYVVPQCIFDVFKEYGLPVPELYKQFVYDEDELKEMGVDLKEISDEDVVDEDTEIETIENEDDLKSEMAKSSAEDNIYGESDDFFNVDENEEEYIDDEENDIIEGNDDNSEFDGITSVEDDFDPFEYDNDEDYYETDFDFMEKFENDMLEYKHDENQIFVDPSKVTASLNEKDFSLAKRNTEPDFSDLQVLKKDDFYDRNQNKSTDLDLRSQCDVEKWGYNDYPIDVKKIRKDMEEKARRDIEELTKEALK